MPDDQEQVRSAAIVLGGGLKKVSAEGVKWYEPQDQAKARLDVAYALFQDGAVDVIISTGNIGPMQAVDPEVMGPLTEAEVGGLYLLVRAEAEGGGAARQRLKEHLLYEDQSIDTITNAWYAKKLCLEPAGITSCIVVTSDYHIERSRIIFEWVLGPGYSVRCVEAPSALSGPEREKRDRFEQMLTEMVRTRLMPAIPAGDDAAMAHFIENEHRQMFLSGPPPSELLPDGFLPPPLG